MRLETFQGLKIVWEFSNSDHSFDHLKVATRMYAAANTPTCIRRGQSNQNLDGAQTTYCDPYGGFNSISTIPASSNDQNVIESLPQKSTVALVVRSDALSFFQSMATGTSHVGVSFVMQLAVAKAINIDKVLDFTLIDDWY